MKACGKKWVAAILCVVMVFATGCNGNGGGADSGSADQDAVSGAASANKESSKKTFENLDGMEIIVGDWYTVDKEPETDYEKDTEKYRAEIQEKYNFKIKREGGLFSFQDQQTRYVNRTMANNQDIQLYYLYQEKVGEPLLKGLMKDLSKLPEFDFSEEKWNPTVKELMSIGDGIWGMSPEKEPRGGIFYNKRLFREAGIPEEEPYDLQKEGKWTWDKFEEYCKKLTVDTDGDGKVDQYAMASFSKYFLPMCAANNNAVFVTHEKDGRYKSAIQTQEFKDAMNWGVELIKKGYMQPKPEGASWDWYKAAFRDGECAMQTAEVYETGSLVNMEDDWGFVMFPYNQENQQATNKTIPNDNIVVMPSCFDDDTAEKIAFAYDLYTEPTEGYSPDDAAVEPYYERFRDERAVDETLAMMRQEEHIQRSYVPMISGIETGDFCYGVYALAATPQKKVEELSSKWDSKINAMNENYEKFARDN